MAHQNLWGTMKAVIREKLIVLYAHSKKLRALKLIMQ